MSSRSGSSRKTKLSRSSSSSKSRKSRKSIKEQVIINKKMELAELEPLAFFFKKIKNTKLTAEEMKLEGELAKLKSQLKVIEGQEELGKGKTLNSV